MSTLTMLFGLLLLTSCGTVHYTKVDKVNMARYEHGQKMIEGLTRNEVLSRFGSPTRASETTFGGKGAVKWTYDYKIFCGTKGTYCAVFFRNDRVIFNVNFRQEFNNTVVNN